MNTQEQVAKIIKSTWSDNCGKFISAEEATTQILTSLASTPDGELKDWLQDYFWKPCDGDKCLVDIDCADCMANEVIAKVSAIYAARVEQAKQEMVKQGWLSPEQVKELFRAVEDAYPITTIGYVIPESDWQSLKSKYLKEK